MYDLPFEIDLSGKSVAITGAGGIICGEFAKALAACGAQVALLDINYDAAEKIANEIGENAIAIRCNCLDKESIKSAYSTVIGAFGKVDILINGAGGNNPKATCDNEIMSPEMLEAEGLKDFFALDESGLKFVFDLNITSAFLVTQVFAEGMVKTGGNIINISSMNAFRPLTKIPAYSAAFKMPIDAIVAMGTKVNSSIKSLSTLVIFAVAPFNILKGVLVGLITFLLYKHVRTVLK